MSKDEQGNPTKYKGNHVTWAKGRRMASYGNMKYRYNPSGSRIGKSDGDTKTAYYLDGTRLIREETISDSNRPYVPGALESIDYHYDGHGTLASLSMKCYNRSVAEYYYLRNTLGDVIALCDAVGNIVAAYEYDAWGGVHGVYDGFGVNRINEQDFVGNLNPIRYRGYYYDTETALYYLQSRYFDPGTGRFVNADSVIDSGHSLFGHNLYAYGNNNPIVRKDPSGCASIGAMDPWTAETVLRALQDAAAALPQVDGPYPFADILALVILGGCALYQNWDGISSAISSGVKSISSAISSTQSISQSRTNENRERKQDRRIYQVAIANMQTSTLYRISGYLTIGEAEALIYVGKKIPSNLVSVKNTINRIPGVNWGIYTQNATDAYLLGALGGVEPMHELATKAGYFDHYHTNVINHGNPHIWYGSAFSLR